MTATTSPGQRLARIALTDVVLPCGVALAVGSVVAFVVTPHWRTIGAPYVPAKFFQFTSVRL